jgi:hypothetical protein
MVASLQGPDLRPAAVGILRGEQIIEAAQKGRAIEWAFVRSNRGDRLRQKFQLSTTATFSTCADSGEPLGYWRN